MRVVSESLPCLVQIFLSTIFFVGLLPRLSRMFILCYELLQDYPTTFVLERDLYLEPPSHLSEKTFHPLFSCQRRSSGSSLPFSFLQPRFWWPEFAFLALFRLGFLFLFWRLDLGLSGGLWCAQPPWWAYSPFGDQI